MSSQYADLIFENAVVITCGAEMPEAQAVAVRGDRILFTGSNREINSLKGPRTRVIDCDQRTLVPGFNDAHCHVFALVRKLFSLDLSPAAVRSIEDIKEAIRRKARYTPGGTWISGTDYNEFYLAEKRHPTRWDLDAAAPHHPVIISHRSLHASVLNSEALKRVGITNETEEPPGGMIDRDLETGEPNGILFEMGEYLRERIDSPISGAEMEWGIAEANRLYLSQGITSLTEATVTNDLQQWRTFQKLKQDGKLKSRISMMAGAGSLTEIKGAGLATGSGDENLRIGSLKIVLSEATGRLMPSQEELDQTVLEAGRAGFQVAIHAVEQSTVEAAVAALEYANGQFSGADSRQRIEHASECPPDLQKRLGSLGAVVVSQPSFLFYSGERYLAQVGPEARQRLYPFRSLTAAGVNVAGSSDSPVVPLNPLVGIYAAVTRKAESGPPVLAGEAIPAEEALRMYTLNAAYAGFEEKSKGSLEPGKLADMVMLSADPLHSALEEIKEIRVLMTVVGGEIVFSD